MCSTPGGTVYTVTVVLIKIAVQAEHLLSLIELLDQSIKQGLNYFIYTTYYFSHTTYIRVIIIELYI